MTDKEINKADLSKDEYFWIWKNGSYYRPNSSGYTDTILDAGIYRKHDAISAAFHCRDIKLIPVNVTQHNQRVIAKIKELSDTLIIQP